MVPACNEPLGVDVEPGPSGSLVPGMVVVHVSPLGAAGRHGQLRVGDLLLKVNGQSLVCLLPREVAAILKSATKARTEVLLEIIPQPPARDATLARASDCDPWGFTLCDGVVAAIQPGSAAERAGLVLGHRIVSVGREPATGWADERLRQACDAAGTSVSVQTMAAHVWDALHRRARASSLGSRFVPP